MKQILLVVLLLAIFSSCTFSLFSRLNGTNMNSIELGMSKDQLIGILGKDFTVSEKRMEEGNLIEVLSYRNYPETNEFYLFVFQNNNLDHWYRELVPIYEIEEN